jgi:hypothetical protein
METTQGISLYSQLYLKLAKLHFSLLSYFFIYSFLIFLFFFLLFIYSHVHTLFGSFLPPAPLLPPSSLSSRKVLFISFVEEKRQYYLLCLFFYKIGEQEGSTDSARRVERGGD